MALIALAADKGSPGVTTAAVALSAVWPRRALLAEVDSAGGDLVYRCSADDGRPLDPNTGMLSLAAMARRGLAAEQLWDHSQRIAGGMDVLLGLAGAEQSTGLAGQWGTLGRAFGSLADSPHEQSAADVLADCGRVGPDSASVELFQHASLLLLLTRAEPEYLARTRDRAAALSMRLHGGLQGETHLAQPAIGVLLVAEPQGGPKVAAQVNEMLVASRTTARVMGVIAHDPVGAEQLAGRRRGRVDKSLLVRSVRRVVSDLHQQFGASWAASRAEPPLRAAGGPEPAGPAPVPGGAAGPVPGSPPPYPAPPQAPQVPPQAGAAYGTPPHGTAPAAPPAGMPTPGAAPGHGPQEQPGPRGRYAGYGGYGEHGTSAAEGVGP